jgi:hypothetical protein
MTEAYTKQEANTLIKYYKPLVIGKIIEGSTGAIINDVSKEIINENEYRVNANAPFRGNYVRRSITKVAKFHNLAMPSDVLDNQTQS